MSVVPVSLPTTGERMKGCEEMEHSASLPQWPVTAGRVLCWHTHSDKAGNNMAMVQIHTVDSHGVNLTYAETSPVQGANRCLLFTGAGKSAILQLCFSPQKRIKQS